jgi:hypothetical protein
LVLHGRAAWNCGSWQGRRRSGSRQSAGSAAGAASPRRKALLTTRWAVGVHAPSVRNRDWSFLSGRKPWPVCDLTVGLPPPLPPRASPRGSGCLLRGSGALALFFPPGAKGDVSSLWLGCWRGKMIPASTKSSRACSLIKSRTLAEAISRPSSSTGCGLDHFVARRPPLTEARDRARRPVVDICGQRCDGACGPC